MQEVSEQYGTAIHEAGHAVLSIKLDKGFKEISIIPNVEEDDNGHITYLISREEMINIVQGYSVTDMSNGELDDMVRKEIMVSYGGYLAESILNPDDEVGNSARASSDFEFIAKISMNQWGPEEVNSNLEQCRTETRQILEANWTHIQNIAQALKEKEILSQEEVMSIMGIEQPNNLQSL